MKQLFFAGGFAITAIVSYSWINAGPVPANEGTTISSQSFTDTTPKRKDTMRKKKHPGKDSLNRKDTTWPKSDTSAQ
ncbi:MAG: hypothetical protein WDO19_03700 [Bacteroidota bacterium]